MRSLKFYAERAHFGRRIQIFVHKAHGDGERAAKPVEFGPVLESGEGIEEAMLSCSQDDAQDLMDALWTAGLRPTEGSGSAGSLAATERHLKDMQTIAFAALKRDGIE